MKADRKALRSGDTSSVARASLLRPSRPESPSPLLTATANPGAEGMTQHVREALYASMTGIATLLVMLPSPAAFTGRSAAGTLLGTMGGLFAASFVADTISHASEHGGATQGKTMRRILGASMRTLEVTLAPAVLVWLSDTGAWDLRTGLTLGIAVLTVAQLLLVLWGLRGSATTKAQKAGYLLLQLAVIAGVVLLKVVVH